MPTFWKALFMIFYYIFHKFTVLYQSDDSVKCFEGENSQQKKIPKLP